MAINEKVIDNELLLILTEAYYASGIKDMSVEDDYDYDDYDILPEQTIIIENKPEK